MMRRTKKRPLSSTENSEPVALKQCKVDCAGDRPLKATNGSPTKQHAAAVTVNSLPLTPLVNDSAEIPSSLGSPGPKKKRRSSCASDRTMPDILNSSTEFGSPHKFWEQLCDRDDSHFQEDKSYYRNSNYMVLHPKLEVSMRHKLFEWLMNVCEDLLLHRETFHLAIDFIDRLFSKSREALDVGPINLQLIGVTALLLATKIEEVYPPKLSELVELTAGACNEKQVRNMEEIILSLLEWHCSPVTGIQWLAFYLHLISRQESSFLVEPFSYQQPQCPNSLTTTDSFPSTNDSLRTPSLPGPMAPTNARRLSISSDSQYESQEPDLFRMPGDFSGASFDSSFIATHPTQTRHMRQFSVPKLMRDDFMVLSKVLEVCLFDMEYLRFSYSQVAAALVMLSYEPRDRVESIIGFRYNDLREAIYFVEPIVRAVRASVLPGVIIPCFSGVDPRDQHNIQTGFPSDYAEIVEQVRKFRAEQQKAGITKKKEPRPARVLF